MIAVLQRSSHCLLLDVKLTLRCHRVVGRKKCMCKREFKRNSHTWSADRVGRTVINTALWAPMSHYFTERNEIAEKSVPDFSFEFCLHHSFHMMCDMLCLIWLWLQEFTTSSQVYSLSYLLHISPPKSLNLSKVGDHFWWPEMLLEL